MSRLTAFYRDVLTIRPAPAPGSSTRRIRDLESVASASTPESTVRRLDAILLCRTALETNVAPLLAMESLMLSLAGRAAW